MAPHEFNVVLRTTTDEFKRLTQNIACFTILSIQQNCMDPSRSSQDCGQSRHSSPEEECSMGGVGRWWWWWWEESSVEQRGGEGMRRGKVEEEEEEHNEGDADRFPILIVLILRPNLNGLKFARERPDAGDNTRIYVDLRSLCQLQCGFLLCCVANEIINFFVSRYSAIKSNQPADRRVANALCTVHTCSYDSILRSRISMA